MDCDLGLKQGPDVALIFHWSLSFANYHSPSRLKESAGVVRSAPLKVLFLVVSWLFWKRDFFFFLFFGCALLSINIILPVAFTKKKRIKENCT